MNPVLIVTTPGILSPFLVVFFFLNGSILTLSFLGFVPFSGAEALSDFHGSPA